MAEEEPNGQLIRSHATSHVKCYKKKKKGKGRKKEKKTNLFCSIDRDGKFPKNVFLHSRSTTRRASRRISQRTLVREKGNGTERESEVTPK